MDGALAAGVTLAVAARAVDLAVVLGVEIDDVDVAAAVVLDAAVAYESVVRIFGWLGDTHGGYVHLVGGLVGTAANDVGGSLAGHGDGVLADVLEPGELDVAAALAVDALDLVGADDDVLDGGAVLEDEHGILLA